MPEKVVMDQHPQDNNSSEEILSSKEIFYELDLHFRNINGLNSLNT